MRCLLLLGLLPCAAHCADLQFAVDRAMAGKPGAAVVADIATGKVLAAHHIERPVSSPGSTLKPFTLAAWIDAHAGASPPAWACPRQLRLSGRRFDCTHPVLATAPSSPSNTGASDGLFRFSAKRR